MSVTDEIKSRIDIVTYVQRHVPALKKAGRNHKACCPFHNEKTPSFVVNPERQTWRCFGACSEGGDLFTFAQKIHGWDFKEALRELGQEAGVQIRQQTPEEQIRSDELEHLRGILASAADIYCQRLFQPEARGVLAYLHDARGIHMETVKAFQLGAAPDSWDFILRSLRELGCQEDEIIEVGLAVRGDKGNVYDRFRNRLMIPIHDERGRVVGFGGRALASDDAVKYINSPQSPLFDKSRLLYGLDRAKAAIREAGAAVIVEGYMDVIQAHQRGFVNVVAQMGTAMTASQLRRIAPRYARKIVLALDADAAGQSATRRSLEVARQALADDMAGKLSLDLRILRLPEGTDPDDLLRQSPEAWPRQVEAAVGVADYVIDSETASLDPAASMQERQRIAQSLLPILLASENSPYQQENLQKLARRLRISERDLLAWARTQSPPARSPGRRSHSAAIADETPDLPPEYWDNEDDAPPMEPGDLGAAASGAPTQPQRAIEPHCLGLLLKDPGLLARVNRKLRELAGSDEALQQGPLRDLSVEDFSLSQYRVLMSAFQEAMAQDDMEPLDHIKISLEGEMRAELTALLSDEKQMVSSQLRGAYQVDLVDIFERSLARGRSITPAAARSVSRALQLRLQRLEQERIEMQYLQEEAGDEAELDPQQRERLRRQVMLSMTAKARLDREVSRYA